MAPLISKTQKSNENLEKRQLGKTTPGGKRSDPKPLKTWSVQSGWCIVLQHRKGVWFCGCSRSLSSSQGAIWFRHCSAFLGVSYLLEAIGEHKFRWLWACDLLMWPDIVRQCIDCTRAEHVLWAVALSGWSHVARRQIMQDFFSDCHFFFPPDSHFFFNFFPSGFTFAAM